MSEPEPTPKKRFPTVRISEISEENRPRWLIEKLGCVPPILRAEAKRARPFGEARGHGATSRGTSPPGRS